MGSQRLKVLLVEGPSEGTGGIISGIKGPSIDLAVAAGLGGAGEECLEKEFDALLVDMALPDGVPLEDLVKIHAAAGYPALIIIAGTDEEAAAIKAACEGVQDYLIKGQIEKNLFVRSIRYAMERSRMTESLRDAEMRLDSLMDGVGEGVVVIDRDYRILTANKGYCGQVGLECEDIIGRPCYEVSHHAAAPCHETRHGCPAKSALERGIGHKLTHTHFNRDGKPFHVEVVSYPIRDRAGNIVSAIEISRDITETIALERDLKKRIRELEEFYDMAVGRELRMLELKEEIENLRKELSGKVS